MFLTALIPLFSVPHTSHLRIAFSSPEEPSRRFPQSVQKTREPIAAIAGTRGSGVAFASTFTKFDRLPAKMLE